MNKVCSTWGNYHYRSFDGKTFDFSGTCPYTLAKDCRPGSQQFTLVIYNARRIAGRNFPRHLALILGRNYYDVSSRGVSKHGKSLSFPFKDSSVTITKIMKYILIRALRSSIHIKFDGRTSFYIALSEEYKNNTCGLCGNFNGIPDDDFKMPSEQQARDVVQFANSWQMLAEHCSRATLYNNVCQNVGIEKRLHAQFKCGVLRSSSFTPCHSKVSVDYFFQRCKEDLCLCNVRNITKCLCDVLTQYSRICAEHGVKLNWRKRGLCRKFLYIQHLLPLC